VRGGGGGMSVAFTELQKRESKIRLEGCRREGGGSEREIRVECVGVRIWGAVDKGVADIRKRGRTRRHSTTRIWVEINQM